MEQALQAEEEEDPLRPARPHPLDDLPPRRQVLPPAREVAPPPLAIRPLMPEPRPVMRPRPRGGRARTQEELEAYRREVQAREREELREAREVIRRGEAANGGAAGGNDADDSMERILNAERGRRGLDVHQERIRNINERVAERERQLMAQYTQHLPEGGQPDPRVINLLEERDPVLINLRREIAGLRGGFFNDAEGQPVG